MNSIFKWLKNKIFFYISLFFLVHFFIAIYCSIFKISYKKFFVYYILPLYDLVINLINIIITVSSFPYYITMELWKILLRILGMFTFVISFINTIALYFINITSDVYLVA